MSETPWLTQRPSRIALSIGKKVLPSEHDHTPSQAGSTDRPRSPGSPQPHAEKVLLAPATSTTRLERVTGADGLVQLLPKKVEDLPKPVPALNGSMKALKRPTLERPLPRKHKLTATTPVDEAAEAGLAEKKAGIPASPNQDSPPPPSTMAKRPTHIDLPKPSMRHPEDRLSPSIMQPPSPENAEAVDITPELPVLVVDDDRVTRMLMQRMLERLGCVVTTAVNGQQALELIAGVSDSQCMDTPGSNEVEYFADGRVASSSASRRIGCPPTPGTPESKFAVVFLDNQMPVLSGVEMVRKLRGLGRKDLIVGVTGNALLPDQEEYLAAGADQCVYYPLLIFRVNRVMTSNSILTKPVREENLRSMLLVADEQRKSRTVSPTLIGSP